MEDQPCDACQQVIYEGYAAQPACLLAYATRTFKIAVFIAIQAFCREDHKRQHYANRARYLTKLFATALFLCRSPPPEY